MELPALLIDLDGTLIERGKPVEGAADAIEELRDAGHVIRVLTNTDGQTPAAIAARVRDMGIPIAADELFTPVTAAVALLAGKRALILADDAVRGEFECQGEPYTHVVVGDCRETLNYATLDSAFRAVRGGAELLALQRGRYFRAADGDHLDTAAVVAAIEYATGQSARVLGKPSLEFFRLAVESTGIAGQVWVVGDDQSTDIAMAAAGGAFSVQVRTGKFADGTLPCADRVIDSVAGLPGLVAACIHRIRS